jgi:hypothetical protein
MVPARLIKGMVHVYQSDVITTIPQFVGFHYPHMGG